MFRQNPPHIHSYFNFQKLKLFFGVFVVSFMIISAAAIIFPKVRQALHQSAVLGGMTSVDNIDTQKVSEAVFKDVPAVHPHSGAISYLKKKGIIQGYEDGTFHPDESLKRGELIKLIVTAKGAEPHQLLNSYCFEDVTDQWFARYVCFAKNKGWIEGYQDGIFDPENQLTRAEALTMILKSFDIRPDAGQSGLSFDDVAADAWYAPYIGTAQSRGWLDRLARDGSFDPDSEITRAQVSELLARVVASEMPLL